MKYMQTKKSASYKPLLFTIFAFLLSWACIFAMESTYLFSYQMPSALLMLLDFAKSTAPLAVALVLLRHHFANKGALIKYIFGERRKAINYVIVSLIFVFNFLLFYFCRQPSLNLTFSIFASTFLGQLVFGGGMEEGGWRGYLLPAINMKMPVVFAATITSVIWTLWHLPYFFIPTSSQYGSSIFAYLLVAVMTGFLLSAIYMLTKSVLLCTLFHAFSNTLTMTLGADMGNVWLMIIYAVMSIGAAVLCHHIDVKERTPHNSKSTPNS